MRLRLATPAAFAAAFALSAADAAAAPAIKPGLLLHYDLVRFEDAPPALRDSNGWRRTRISLAASLPGGGDAKLEHDFTSDTFTDAYLRFPVGAGKLTLGQFKQPFSADALLSDTQQFTTESSVAAAFAPGRRLGVQYARGSFAASLYGRDLHDAGPDLGVAGRWYGSRGDADGGLWHYAGSAAFEQPRDDSSSLRLRPDVNSRSGSWLSSGALPAERLQRFGVEGGWQQGRLLLLAELLALRFDDGARSRSAEGGYLTASWTVRGSPRSYEKGLFGLPKASAPGLGHLELVARYADLSAPRAAGGDIGQHGWSLGLNAQVGKHARLMLDRHASERSTDDADAALWTLRLQWQM